MTILFCSERLPTMLMAFIFEALGRFPEFREISEKFEIFPISCKTSEEVIGRQSAYDPDIVVLPPNFGKEDTRKVFEIFKHLLKNVKILCWERIEISEGQHPADVVYLATESNI